MTPQSLLLSGPGQELLDRLAGEDVTPDRSLQLAKSLRQTQPPELIAAALAQQALRRRGRAKFSRADAMLFTAAGLEQASSELTAGHSARRFRPFPAVADLCCGIGGNLAALAGGSRVLAVDRDLTSLEFARHNAAVCGPAHPVHVVCADVRRLPLHIGAAFADPARRSGGRRLPSGASEPPLDWCLQLADAIPAVGIKAAPGLPRDIVPAGWELEFVAVGRSLKEGLLWSPALATAARRATILPGADTITASAGPGVPVSQPGEFLLDPNPAVTRAGLVEELARELGAAKIDPMIAFLTADRELSTPFARTLRVVESIPWNEKQVSRRLRELGIGVADIRRRGLAGDVALMRRRLGQHGEATATVVITRSSGRPWGLICVPVTRDQ